MSTKDSWELSIDINEINDVAEMIHHELYGTWKYQDLERAAMYGSRTFSPKCFWAVTHLIPVINGICETLNNHPKLLTCKKDLKTHLEKLYKQELKAYEFYDANALYMDLARFSLAILEVLNEMEESNG